MAKVRGFVVTNWNLITREDYQAIIDRGQIRYIAWGEETCPETGRRHHQAFCYFHNPLSTSKRNLNKIGNMFGEVHANVEPMRGSFTQNTAYCSKEGSYHTVGDAPSQGARGDIEEIRDAILSGTTTSDEVCEADPAFHHQYGRTLDRLEAIALRKKWRQWPTKGIWYTGPTGAGKSHKVFDNYHPDTHYVKNLNEDWWDGYKGQEYVILNEFRGQISFSELLDLADKWPKTVKWRGKESVPFLAKYVLVASIKTPQDVYRRQCEDEPWGQFHRRFEVIELESRGNEPVVPLNPVRRHPCISEFM